MRVRAGVNGSEWRRVRISVWKRVRMRVGAQVGVRVMCVTALDKYKKRRKKRNNKPLQAVTQKKYYRDLFYFTLLRINFHSPKFSSDDYYFTTTIFKNF